MAKVAAYPFKAPTAPDPTENGGPVGLPAAAPEGLLLGLCSHGYSLSFRRRLAYFISDYPYKYTKRCLNDFYGPHG